MDSNKTLEDKDRWEVGNDAMCYFKQILEAEPYKTTSVQLLISHLTYPN